MTAAEDCLANTCSGLQTAEGATKCSDGLEPNMTAVLLDGQPVFEVTRSISPHTPIVVQFQGLSVHSGTSPAELQGNCSIPIYTYVTCFMTVRDTAILRHDINLSAFITKNVFTVRYG